MAATHDHMISLICVYNSPRVFQDMSRSLAGQTAVHELIEIDNTTNRFPSAASALNYGATLAHGDILVFLHQDVLFRQSWGLQAIADELTSLQENAILGLYGAGGDIVYGEMPTIPLTAAETLDECLIAMKQSTWQSFNFNEALCNGWHLYAVELCLRASAGGCGIYQMNGLPIEHLSMGEVNEQYMKTYRRLMNAYPDKKSIKTTCVSLPNNQFLFNVYHFIWRIKKMILGNTPLRSNLRDVLHRVTGR